MALFDVLNSTILAGTVLAPKPGESSEVLLERMWDMLHSKQFGEYYPERCTFVAVECKLPDNMIQNMKAQHIVPPDSGFLMMTFILHGAEKLNQA